MKRIKITFKQLSANFQEYKFCIKTVQKAGEVHTWPMVKAPGFFSQWRPLVRVENEVIVMDYETPGGLPLSDCYERIATFKDQLANQEYNSQFTVEYKEVTDNDLSQRYNSLYDTSDVDEW